MLLPPDEPIERRGWIRLIVLACGLGVGAALLVIALIGLALGMGLPTPISAQQPLGAPTQIGGSPLSGGAGAETGEPGTATPTLNAASVTSAPIPTVTPIPPASASPTPVPSAATGTNTPVNPAPVSPAVTVTSAIPTITVPQGPMRVGNGPDLYAPYIPTNQFNLDGQLSEWPQTGVPLTHAHGNVRNWKGLQDESGIGWVGWNEDYVLFAARVVDDVHVQTQTGWNMYRGDSIELWLDTDLAGDFNNPNGDADDWQFGFSAGDFNRLRPEGVVYLPVRNLLLNSQIRVAAQLLPDGYTLEAQVPWSMLKTQPAPGMVLGYDIDLSDNDLPGAARQQTQVNENPNFRFNVPTTFGNLILR